MLLPINDDNPLEGITHAYVTWALIAVNIAIFVLVQHGYRPEVDIATVFGYGAIPAVVNHAAVLPAEYERLPPELTLLSYMFLHGGWLHLLGNMAFLWVFGDNVEDALGHGRYLLFYIACGVAGGLAHAWSVPEATQPLVGASAAVSGLVGAYLMLHPNVRIWVLMFMRIPLKVPAIWPLGAWISFQLWSALRSGEAETAFWAHIGGLVTGAALVVVMRRRGVPLWVLSRDGTPGGAPPV